MRSTPRVCTLVLFIIQAKILKIEQIRHISQAKVYLQVGRYVHSAQSRPATLYEDMSARSRVRGPEKLLRMRKLMEARAPPIASHLG